MARASLKETAYDDMIADLSSPSPVPSFVWAQWRPPRHFTRYKATTMVIRCSKALLTAAIALFASLAAFGNVTDYGTNLEFVRHVMRMDTVFPTATITYRAIESEAVHHAAYVFIIVLEAMTAVLCWMGAWRMLRSRRQPAEAFNREKRLAIAGLTLGFLVWQVGFMSIGGEWFGMWMSPEWNGVPSAFRFFVTIGIVLVYVAQRDGEIGE